MALLFCPTVEAQAPAAQAPPATPPVEPQPPTAAAATPAAATPAAAPQPERPRAAPLNQSYRSLKVLTEDEEKKLRSDRSQVQKFLRSGTIPADQEGFVRKYYNEYALARWTWLDRQSDVSAYRRELRNELAMSYKANRASNQAHDRLVTLVFEFMKNCVNPQVLARLNLTPTVRFNAILMIGELNQVEAAAGGKDPKPLPDALPILYAVAQDPRQIDAVKLGAILGLRRHCKLGVADNDYLNRRVIPFLAGLARAKEPERVRSEEGHAWLRVIAIQTIADLGGAPNPAGFARILQEIIAEKDSPAFLRFAAANALENLQYQNAAGLDTDSLLHTLGSLAIEVCDEERQRLRDEMESKKTQSTSAYGGYGGYPGSPGGGGEDDMSSEDMGGYEGEMYGGYSGYGGMSSSPTQTKADRQIERARRRLREAFGAVLIGMGKKRKTLARNEQPTGLNVLATAPAEEKKIVDISNPIHDFCVLIDEKDDNDKQIEAKALDDAIADLRLKLADALAQVGPAAPASPEFEPLPEAKPAASSMYGPAGYGGR